MKAAVIAAAGLMLLAACGGGVDRGGPSTESSFSVLPESDEVPGWQRAGQPGIFHGSELYGHINGGSEVFLELGFDFLEVQVYSSGEDELAVEAYHMADPAAALGIYLMKSGAEVPHPALPYRCTASELQIQVVRRATYLNLVNLSGGSPAANALQAFADRVAAGIPAGEAVAELALLDPHEQLPSSVRILRGPFTLEALFTLGSGDVLQLAATGTTAVAADYGHPDAPETYIVADYGSAEAARQVYEHLISNLDQYLEPIDQDDYGLVFKDWQGHFGWFGPTDSRLEIWVNLERHPSNES